MSRSLKKITRRTLLRGAGAAMGLPLLEAMMPMKAFGTVPAGRAPKRAAYVYLPGGVIMEFWKPKATGALRALPSTLQPLEAVKDQLLVVSGLAYFTPTTFWKHDVYRDVPEVAQGEINGHDTPCVHLTGTRPWPVPRKQGAGQKGFATSLTCGVSVDQEIARHYAGQTPIDSLHLSNRVPDQLCRALSWRQPNTPAGVEEQPKLVFDRMFRGRAPRIPNWSRGGGSASRPTARLSDEDALKKSVIDHVLEEAKRLQRAGISRSDKQKIDEYLESVRSVEKRIEFTAKREVEEDRSTARSSKSKSPDLKALVSGLERDLDDKKHRVGELYAVRVEGKDSGNPQGELLTHEVMVEKIKLMFDLTVLAFMTDTTRVATVLMGLEQGPMHGMAHGTGRPNPKDAPAKKAEKEFNRRWFARLNLEYTRLFGDMLKKMRDVDEGNGSLLDNSFVMYGGFGETVLHQHMDLPILVAGRAGGAVKTGRHIDLGKEKYTRLSNLHLETLNRFGVKSSQFGDKYCGSTGRFPELG